MKRHLARVAFTSVVLAPAVDVRRLFRGLALGAAMLISVKILVAGKTFFCTERHTGHRRKNFIEPLASAAARSALSHTELIVSVLGIQKSEGRAGVTRSVDASAGTMIRTVTRLSIQV